MASATLWFGVDPEHSEGRTSTAVDRQASSTEKALTKHHPTTFASFMFISPELI